MPANCNPTTASAYELRPVELQGDYCRPPGRATPHDVIAFIGPGKMLVPAFVTWIEEPDNQATVWIQRGYAISLMFVTTRAGQPQIVLIRVAAE